MFNDGFVKEKNDPHKDISGIKRQVYLVETLQNLILQAEN